MYCNINTFNNLDELSIHLAKVDNLGVNICNGLDMRIDPHKAGELYPMKILGRKYPMIRHDGVFMMLTNEGKVSKTQLVKYMIHGLTID